MLKVGITGGIGCGKSTIAKAFNILGVPVYNADLEAQKVYITHESVKKNIIYTFGEAAYLNNQINKQFLSDIIFSNKEKLIQLNAIVHPVVIQGFKNWCAEKQKQKYKYIIKESALIFESQSFKELDFIIGVSCKEEERIKRIMVRDNATLEKIKNIINLQMDATKKMALCDKIIENENDTFVLPAILEIHSHLQKSGC